MVLGGKSTALPLAASDSMGPSSDHLPRVQGVAVEALEGLNTHPGIHQHIVDELGVDDNGSCAGRPEEN